MPPTGRADRYWNDEFEETPKKAIKSSTFQVFSQKNDNVRHALCVCPAWPSSDTRDTINPREVCICQMSPCVLCMQKRTSMNRKNEMHGHWWLDTK